MTNAPLPGMGSTLSGSASAQAQPETQPAPFGSPLAPLVTMTERAAQKATTILAERDQPDGMLRVFVVGGGCSGHQYGMSIAERAENTDTLVEIEDGVNVVVDRDSVPMIAGAEIDYVEDLMKSGFTIYNPNAVSACACGSSFQTADNAGTPRPCA